MKINFLLAFLFLASACALSQESNPKIGSEKGVKNKLIRIKNALPDLKKNLTERDENFPDSCIVKLKMGNGIVIFKEDEVDKTQSLTIRYSQSNFSGSRADYQSHYKTLSRLIKSVFGTGYLSKASEKKNIWETIFYQSDKDEFNSPVRLLLKYSFILIFPSITITIYSRP